MDVDAKGSRASKRNQNVGSLSKLLSRNHEFNMFQGLIPRVDLQGG